MSPQARITIPRRKARDYSLVAKAVYGLTLRQFALACMREKMLTDRQPHGFSPGVLKGVVAR